ncbi:MAG: hypothetical protein A2Z38_10060 [Planctomycetes bacterium RBG_19FT_COMBO_48_8]|nr:MAG: hypothetical protein A2Z38_10060 [Planctomycetes bacterium RBG_19FT_COMBO_48_8]
MKEATICNIVFSKIICGTNPFYGHSHFSESRNAEYLGRFDDGTIERTILRCISLGINTVESCANERIVSILSRLRDKNPEPIHFVGSTRVDETSDIKNHQQKLAFLIEKRANICVVHAQYVDRPRKGDDIRGLPQLIEKIHDAGLLAGISTHRVETVELCERQGYGIDTYLFPLNLSGFVYPGYEGTESVQERINIVRNTPKPFILIKALGAGRIPPDEGLQFIAENAKSNDLISIGFGTEDEVSETLELVEKLF